MSRWYRNEEQQRGYDARKEDKWSDRYAGDSDYQEGWLERHREERRSQERREEEQRQEAEEEEERQKELSRHRQIEECPPEDEANP